MQKRLFVAISLPEDIKKRLFRFVEKEYKNLPVKWVRQENFHLTLNFLGLYFRRKYSRNLRINSASCRKFSVFRTANLRKRNWDRTAK